MILLPGGVMPAQLAYADLIAALGSDVDAVAKELEMYSGPEPRRFQDVWLERRARSQAVVMPTAIATIGMGHHQCSQRAPKP